MEKIKLSILICTVTNRIDNFLPEIIKELQRQAENKSVEILYLGDNRKRTIGAKRNDLMMLAQGEYSVYVDDDDRVTADFVDEILKAIPNGSDVINYIVEYVNKKNNLRVPVYYNINHDRDWNEEKAYYRMPNPRVAIKTELLNQIWFIDANWGEDSDMARQIRPLLKTQTLIDKILYYYDYDELTSEARP